MRMGRMLLAVVSLLTAVVVSGCSASGSGSAPSAATVSATRQPSSAAPSTPDSGEQFRQELNSYASSQGIPVTAEDWRVKDLAEQLGETELLGGLNETWVKQTPSEQARTCAAFASDPQGTVSDLANVVSPPLNATLISAWLGSKC